MGRILAVLTSVLLAAGCSGPPPTGPPPDEVFLDIRYAALGWTPDRQELRFVKILREKRDYRWGTYDYLVPKSWLREVTTTTFVICGVGPDGQNRRELYSLSNLPAMTAWHNTAVTENDEIVLAEERKLWLLSHEGERLVAELPFDPRLLDYSAVHGSVVVGDGKTGLRRVELATGQILALTQGRDRHARWSPDGRQIFFIRWTDDGTTGLFLLDVASGESRKLAKKKLQQGLAPEGVTWHEPFVIRIGSDYVPAEPWRLEGDLSIHALPAPGTCVRQEERYLVSNVGCGQDDPGAYGYSGEMGPLGVFGLDNVAGTLKIVTVEDYVPVKFGHPQYPAGILEYSSCRLRNPLCLEGKEIEISSDARWDEEIAKLRDSEGALW